jgi:hypothetical protein
MGISGVGTGAAGGAFAEKSIMRLDGMKRGRWRKGAIAQHA